jgi:hypothetical protein
VDLYIHSPIRLHGVVLNYLSTGTTLHFNMYITHKSMLGGSLVTTAWRVLRLRMEETPSSFGG